MFKPTQQNFKPREIVPAGTHASRLVSFIELGIQEGEYKGTPTSQHKVYLVWELPNEMREFDGLSKPMVIGKEFTFSMSPKSRFRPVIEGMLGVKLTDQEAYNIDFEENTLLGTACMVSVSHREGARGAYATIESVVPVPKGMNVPEQFNESVFYLLRHGDNDVFQGLPNFIKEKIAQSKSSQKVDSSVADKLAKARQSYNQVDEIDMSEIPFD